jgi:hypothetical protein
MDNSYGTEGVSLNREQPAMGRTLKDAIVRVEKAFNGIEAPEDTERRSKEEVE